LSIMMVFAPALEKPCPETDIQLQSFAKILQLSWPI
jgi:hypothetical protein